MFSCDNSWIVTGASQYLVMIKKSNGRSASGGCAGGFLQCVDCGGATPYAANWGIFDFETSPTCGNQIFQFKRVSATGNDAFNGEYQMSTQKTHALSGVPIWLNSKNSQFFFLCKRVTTARHCANEGEHCSCTGRVSYGAKATGMFAGDEQHWSYKEIIGGITCNNRAFKSTKYPTGDPFPYETKSCRCESYRSMWMTWGLNSDGTINAEIRRQSEDFNSNAWCWTSGPVAEWGQHKDPKELAFSFWQKPEIKYNIVRN